MNTFRIWACALATASLVSCGGGGGGNDDFGGINCAGLTGATVSQSIQCNAGTCSGNYQDAAIDGDLGTYAVLDVGPNAAGSVHLRATAQDGVTYPAGTPAAVVYGIARTGGSSLNTAETISTYLDGVLQQTGSANTGFGSTNEGVEGGRRAIGTTMPFDAIEMTYTQTGGAADVEVQVYEFCTSTN